MKILLILIVSLIPLSSFARKPAVEPVTGISIEEYRDVPPSKAKGFDWGQEKGKRKSVTNNTQSAIQVDKLPAQEIDSETAPNLTPAIVLLFMLVLPFGIWFFMLGKLENPSNEVGFQEKEDPDNMLAFPKKKESEDGDDDDHNLPKAS